MPILLRDYVRHSRSLLRDRLLALLPEQGSYPTLIQGLALHRYDVGEASGSTECAPVLVVVVQGKQWVRTGAAKYSYGPRSCFVAGVGLPVSYGVREATPEKPCLVLTMDLEPALLWRLSDLAHSQAQVEAAPPEAGVRKIGFDLMDSFVRLLDVLFRPEQIAFLAPLYIEEIHYRLLASPLGEALRAIPWRGVL